MAIRKKTIQFATTRSAQTISNATWREMDTFNIFIPESSPVFTSVAVEVGFMDQVTATGGTITQYQVGLKLGANTEEVNNYTGTITNTGENISGVFGPVDYTTYFNTYWSGTSMTCDIRLYFNQSTGTTLGMVNPSVTIYITYEYDDKAPTQIKTVRIPLESLTTRPPITATNFGTNQIPQLTGVGGMLPENSPVIRDYYFLIEGNDSRNNTTNNCTLNLNIDGGTTYSPFMPPTALGSDRYIRYIYEPTIPDTSTSHNLQMWVTPAQTILNHVTVTLIVTYEFTLSGTSRVLNSLILPMEISSPVGQNVSGDKSRFTRKFFIEEAGTITLKQSAVRIHWNANNTVTQFRVAAGSQTERSYTVNANVVCGMFCLQQRIDSGSEAGTGITLSRGLNELVVDAYVTHATVRATNVNGYSIINYESDVTGTPGAHSHTVMETLIPWVSTFGDLIRASGHSFDIPENNYWIVSSGFYMNMFISTGGMAISLDAEVLSGESKGAGYADIYVDNYVSDAEMSCSVTWMRGRDVFKRYPQDPDADRLDITTSRDFRLYTTSNSINGVMNVVTYHTHTFTSTLTITDSSGGTVNIDVFRADTDEKILSTSRVGNGTVDLTWYDNTLDCYLVAYESDTKLARSPNFKFGD